MVRAVVDDVLQHLPERLRLQLSVPAAVFDRTQDALRSQTIHDGPDSCLFVLPRRADPGQIVVQLWFRQCHRRLAFPPRSPDPIGAAQMDHRVEDRREAIAERSPQLLLGQRVHGHEQPVSRPVVIVHERLQHVERHRISSAYCRSRAATLHAWLTRPVS